jgi:hypothetical protein
MTGHRYWQVLNTAISTDWRVREGFLAPEFQATLARQYPRLVELFGESKVFHELRQRLLFREYLKVALAAHQNGAKFAAVGRALLREIARKISLLS